MSAAIRCACFINRLRSIGAGLVEDGEGLLSLGGDNAGRVVVSAESARAIVYAFGSSQGRWEVRIEQALSASMKKSR
jgi:hypothetical protein